MGLFKGELLVRVWYLYRNSVMIAQTVFHLFFRPSDAFSHPQVLPVKSLRLEMIVASLMQARHARLPVECALDVMLLVC